MNENIDESLNRFIYVKFPRAFDGELLSKAQQVMKHLRSISQLHSQALNNMIYLFE